LKILAVCGMGLGSSLIIKMTVDAALRRIGVDAEVETADIGTARALLNKADMVVTSKHLAEQMGDIGDVKMIVVKNLMSEDEVAEKLQQALSDDS